jgi:5-methylcytosine-specific restriction endonuclease McrA
MAKIVNYRKLAFDNYLPICSFCGFGLKSVLEVAHLDGNRTNNKLNNLAILCPTCHRMHDLDLITSTTIILTRSRMQKGEKAVNWEKLFKSDSKTRSERARKAAKTRKKHTLKANQKK